MVYIAALALTDFRSYGSLAMGLDPGVTTLTGPNGQGKTNLVEAVDYLATLRSHRVATDAPLVRQGAARAVIRARVITAERPVVVEIEINPGRPNRVQVNRAPLPRPREVLGVVRTVLFAPDDIALVKGEPAERRRFLDDLLVARTPRYAGVRADYERVLKQRNALLRSAREGRHAAALRTLDVWDAHLAQAGAELLAGRLALVAALQPRVADAYDAVAGAAGHRAGLAYRGAFGEVEPAVDRAALAGMLREAMAGCRGEELERGVSLVGPHRDELVVRLGELPARGYASHGESWSLALALRLASFALLRAEGEEPVLLLDDVFAELDVVRRERLARLVAAARQVVVTAAVPEDVPSALDGARYEVADGEVLRVR